MHDPHIHRHSEFMFKFVPFVLIAFMAFVFVFIYQKNKEYARSIRSNQLKPITTESVVSMKPRDRMISYIVEEGDSLSSIANKFGISEDTIRWANDLSGDAAQIGTELQIPPVTGVVHTVVEGDTIETIAAKYHVDPQSILNFPFNEYADETVHTLTQGQILYVPSGIKN